MKNLLLLSRIYTTNMGDQMIGRSMVSLFSPYANVHQGDICSKVTSVSINLDKFNPHSQQEKSTFFSQYLSKCCHNSMAKNISMLIKNRSIFKVLFNKRFDLIIIGGGELVSPSFSFILMVWFIMIKIFQHKADVVFFGVGVAALENKDVKRLRRMISDAKKIFVRDSYSVKQMELLFNRDAVEIPDVVYANDFIRNEKKTLTLYGITSFARLRKHKSHYSDEKDYFISSFNEIKTLIMRGESVFLFYTSQDDLKACLKFRLFCLEKYHQDIEISYYRSVDELLAILKKTKQLYSPRMHGCIMGQLCGASVHPILISEKMLSYKKKYLNNYDIVHAKQTLFHYSQMVVS